MRKTFILFFIVLLPVQLFAQVDRSVRDRPLVFRDATVIDMRSGQPQPNMTVIVSGRRISAIGRNIKIPKNADIIDAGGKFLIPGLWDMHVHFFNNVSRVGTHNKEQMFPLLLANGVTGMRDMFSDPEDIKLARKWNAEIEAGKLVGPHIFVGSRIVDGVPNFIPGVQGVLGVKNAEEARRAVRALKAEGAGFIKVYWTLSPESYFAVADEAKRQNIVFAGHVPFLVSARDASNAGQKSIEHLTGILETCSSKEDELRKKEWTPEVQRELEATFDAKKCFELYKLFAKNRTYQVPTAVLHRGMLFYDDENFRSDPNFKYIPETDLKDWAVSPQLNKTHSFEERRKIFAWMLGIIGEMHRAGVPILAGTDNNNPFVIPGFSLHDELEIFVRAGMTPFEALKTATTNPAKYMEMENSYGTIEKGKIADLVLLDANPLENIGNTRKISAVIAGGRYLSKETLEKMLTDVERQANRK